MHDTENVNAALMTAYKKNLHMDNGECYSDVLLVAENSIIGASTKLNCHALLLGNLLCRQLKGDILSVFKIICSRFK